MYLHPDGIARRIRWEGNDGGAPDWTRVVAAVCQPVVAAAAKSRPVRKRTAPAQAVLDRAGLVKGLREMAPALLRVLNQGEALGIEPEVLRRLEQLT